MERIILMCLMLCWLGVQGMPLSEKEEILTEILEKIIPLKEKELFDKEGSLEENHLIKKEFGVRDENQDRQEQLREVKQDERDLSQLLRLTDELKKKIMAEKEQSHSDKVDLSEQKEVKSVNEMLPAEKESTKVEQEKEITKEEIALKEQVAEKQDDVNADAEAPQVEEKENERKALIENLKKLISEREQAQESVVVKPLDKKRIKIEEEGKAQKEMIEEKDTQKEDKKELSSSELTEQKLEAAKVEDKREQFLQEVAEKLEYISKRIKHRQQGGSIDKLITKEKASMPVEKKESVMKEEDVKKEEVKEEEVKEEVKEEEVKEEEVKEVEEQGVKEEVKVEEAKEQEDELTERDVLEKILQQLVARRLKEETN